MAHTEKRIVEKLLNMADIKINGDRPWDIHVHNPQFYKRVLKNRELGVGESYMEGFWDCDQIDGAVTRVLRADLQDQVKLDKKFLTLLIFNKLFNLQTKQRALIVGQKHYDIGNDLYQHMLDKELNYSCAYWKNADNLDQAQFNKLDLICKKLQLKPGMRLLDIGCGWGSMARHAARHYGVDVVGYTISREQKALADERNQGLPITIHLQDYRSINERFDRIVSIGMFEHVGIKNYKTYFDVAHRVLKDDGLFLLHSIGDHKSRGISNPWITRYIFQNGALPSMQHVAGLIDKKFVLEDWHSFGADYDKTLMAWHKNFNAYWPTLRTSNPKYDERFKRMWDFYLLSCAGSFRARNIQLWQWVLSKKGMLGGYESVR